MCLANGWNLKTSGSVAKPIVQLSSIFRLPPEIFEIIFIYGARDHYENSDHYILSVPSWVNVSYVCRHWRDVALSCPTLWTYHFTVSLRWTEEILARSKLAPLKTRLFFHGGTNRPWISNLVIKILGCMEHIQELQLRLPDHVLHPEPSLLHAPYPRNLEIRTGSQLSVLIHGNAPALCVLELSQCEVRWDSHMALSGLTSLSLSHYATPCLRQHVAKFLAMLNHMHNLTDLFLDEALASARGRVPHDVTFLNVDLPCLNRLLVIAPLSAVVALLSCVNIPLKAQIRLEFQSETDPSMDEYAPISQFIAQRFIVAEDPTLSHPPVRSLVIEPTPLRVGFVFSTKDHDFGTMISDEKWDRNIPLIINIDVDEIEPPMESSEDRIVSDICCSIPSTGIQSLHVIDPTHSSALWRTILEHLQELRYMKLSGGRMPDLAPVLAPATDRHMENTNENATDNSDSDHILAQALEALELDDIEFWTYIDLDGQDIRHAARMQSLHTALANRKQSRGRLAMTNCRVVNIDGKSFWYEMVGSWENGCLNVVNESRE